MGWPCRAELWGETMDQARADYASVANAVAAQDHQGFPKVLWTASEGGRRPIAEPIGRCSGPR